MVRAGPSRRPKQTEQEIDAQAIRILKDLRLKEPAEGLTPAEEAEAEFRSALPKRVRGWSFDRIQKRLIQQVPKIIRDQTDMASWVDGDKTVGGEFMDGPPRIRPDYMGVVQQRTRLKIDRQLERLLGNRIVAGVDQKAWDAARNRWGRDARSAAGIADSPGKDISRARREAYEAAVERLATELQSLAKRAVRLKTVLYQTRKRDGGPSDGFRAGVKKRNRWMRAEFKTLRAKRVEAHEALDKVRSSVGRKTFGSWVGARLGPELVRKIVYSKRWD